MKKRNKLVQRVFCSLLSISLLLPYASVYAAGEDAQEPEVAVEEAAAEDEAEEAEVLPADTEEPQAEAAEKEVSPIDEAYADVEVRTVQVERPDGSYAEAVDITDFCLIEDHTIKSYGGNFKAIIIPDKYWDSNVKDNRECSAIANYVFEGHTELEEVYFANNTNYIGNYAFANTGLKSVTFSPSMTGFGSYAFYNCKELEEVTFVPDLDVAITEWGNGTFQNCPKLKKITLSNKVWSLPASFAEDCPELEEVVWPDLGPVVTLSIGTYAFRSDKKLKSSDFSETTLAEIGPGAFGGCEMLPVPKFPATLTTIGDQAFRAACTGEGVIPASLTIPRSVKTIGHSAFSDIPTITELTFEANGTGMFDTPSTIEFTENGSATTFTRCTGIKKIVLSDRTPSIPSAFAEECTALETVVWPENLAEIDAYAFRDDENLVSSDFSKTQLKTLGYGVFSSCSKMPVPKFPDTIEEIGSGCFRSIGTGENVPTAELTIPRSVKGIEDCAFAYIPIITKLTFEANASSDPENIITFYENGSAGTFRGCKGITSIVLSDRTPNIPSAFAEDCTALETVVWPANLTEIDAYAFRGDEKLISSDLSKTTLKTLNAGVFHNCSILPMVKFPATIEHIGAQAFSSTPLAENGKGGTLVIPRSVTEIGHSAFYNCSDLEHVIFEANEQGKEATTITFYSNGSASTFGSCTNLMIMELSDRITEIPSAFTRGCDNPILLKNGTAVTSIGGYAFLPEESGLHEIVLINCNGTLKNYDWKTDRRVVVDGAVCVSLKEEYTVTVGESLDLKPEYRLLPEDSVMPVLLWSSSAESYVTVSEGKVKGIKEGYAYVNVATLDGIKKGSCKINVVKKGSGDPDPKPVDPPTPVPGSGEPTDPQPEITAEATQELTLVVGQKFNVGKGWKSSDSKTLSVNIKTGAVKAKKADTATMTHEDGAHTISVTIVKPSVKKSTKLEAGATETLTVTGAEGLNILWCSSAPDIATVNEEGLVTAVAKGSAKITAWVNGSAYKCTVKVTETTPAKERTLHLNVNGGSKTVKIKGLTKPEWKLEEGSEEGIVEILRGKKIKGKAAGTVTLVSGNGEYKVDVTVEDPTIVGSAAKTPYKKTEELNVGGTASFKLTGITQDVVFKSSKSGVAFVSPLPDEDGNYMITARGKGTAKLTAKVNGKSITITVKVK